ncbi:MAG: c-type cytochrome domain-containing protein [Prosthecobacter sp.]
MILFRHSLPALFLTASLAGAVDFKKDIQPILEKNCYECHSEKAKKRKGGFVFDDLETFKLDIADTDVAQIRPGKPGESHFLEVIVNEGHKNHMPPNDTLSRGDINKITDWIKEGATFDGTSQTASATTASAPKKQLPPIMSWTNSEGKTIKAGFVRLDGESVVLRMPANGQEVPYPLAKLNAASQQQAKDAGAP